MITVSNFISVSLHSFIFLWTSLGYFLINLGYFYLLSISRSEDIPFFFDLNYFRGNSFLNFLLTQVGHLHARCSKEVTVTFWSSQPVTLKQLMRCKISRVEFKQPIEEVADWDDRHRTVKWLSALYTVSQESQQPESKKVEIVPISLTKTCLIPA